jgi:hypothetical protein
MVEGLITIAFGVIPILFRKKLSKDITQFNNFIMRKAFNTDFPTTDEINELSVILVGSVIMLTGVIQIVNY